MDFKGWGDREGWKSPEGLQGPLKEQQEGAATAWAKHVRQLCLCGDS